MDTLCVKCEALKKVLRSLEWSDYDDILGSVCPSCGSPCGEGHSQDCDLMRALK